ncbi:MAG: alcohol dehydrogenase family protein [Cyanobacteria bacterium P01_H01_bin.58]
MSEIPETMRGVWLTGHGDFDKLEFRNDLPVPQPGAQDVLVQVAATAVNNTDINTRLAWYSKEKGASDDASWTGEPIKFPRIQGIDICGHIVAVGADVAPSRLGERVLVEPCLREANGAELPSPWFLGSECDGGFAEYAVVASRHVHKVESPLSDVELASFPCSYSTAANLLTRSGVKAGDHVLVTGASGGVGSAAVQLAKARGAAVIAITSLAKADNLLALGAKQTLTRTDSLIENLGQNSVDVVVDLVAGDRWPELLDVLKPGGQYAVAGAVGGPMVQLDVRTLYLKDLTLHGCTVYEPSVFLNLIDRIEKGHIAPLVAHTFPLEHIVEAQKAFLAKGYTGKIVLTVSEP